MKKIIGAVTFVLAISLHAQAQTTAKVETVAKEVLKAYKTKNVELLKKNASGLVRNTINENYFKDKGIQESMEPVAGWNGTIKEIRYNSENLMGNFVILATAYYSDHSDEQINAVMLSTMDNKKWVFFGSGLAQMEKEEFAALSTSVPQPPKKEAKAVKSKKSKYKMSIELADGGSFTQVDEATLAESFNSLNADNFFMILSDGGDFVQAAWSDGDYVVQYNVDGVQYEAQKVLAKETAFNVFKKYHAGDSQWQEGVEWVEQ
jgi:hypothetical protein